MCAALLAPTSPKVLKSRWEAKRESRAAGAGEASVNKEAQLTTLMVVGLAVALFGWAIVHLSSRGHPNGNDRLATSTRLRRWLNALFDRMWKAAE
jgi:hypothetical protein